MQYVAGRKSTTRSGVQQSQDKRQCLDAAEIIKVARPVLDLRSDVDLEPTVLSSAIPTDRDVA